MKILFLTMVIGINNIALCQSNMESQIIQKAQLLTLYRYDLQHIDSILSELSKQPAQISKSPYFRDTYFIKIKFDQSTKFDSFTECYYYLAYNLASNMFYKLGGFQELDIDLFFNTAYKDDMIELPVPVTELIDLSCLFDYYKLKPKKKLKETLCYPKIDDCLLFSITVNKNN